MITISVPSLRPLESRKLGALRKVAATVRQSRAPTPLLVGAYAREIWFWHLHGVETERATEDLDISLELSDWRGFDKFAARLCQAGFEQPVPSHPEKLIDAKTGQKIDLLPFGRISEDGASIVWPADGSRWSVVGFADSYRVAPMLLAGTRRTSLIRVATLPAMVMLKIVAFNERLLDRKKKDGADICFTMTHYLEAGQRQRLVRGVDADIMESVEGDLQRATVVLLGRDMGETASPATRAVLAGHLRRETESASRCPLARELTQRVTQGDFRRARSLLRDLLVGLEHRAHA